MDAEVTMRNMKTRRATVALCLAACTATAARGGPAEEERYTCRALALEPVLDGKVEGDASWKDAAAEGRFHRFGSAEPPSRKTRFRIGSTDEALFIGVECEEPETGKLKSALPDMGDLWTEDSIEMFILPRGSDAYYQFIVNASGSRWNGLGGVSGVRLGLLDWQARTHVAPDAWSLEVRIPWKIINCVPGRDDEWSLNVCRNVVGPVGGTENLTWAYVKASFHEPESFGKLAFTRKVSPGEWKAKKVARPGARGPKVLLYSRPLGRKGKLGTFLQQGASKRRISFIQGPHVAPRLSPDGKAVLLHSNRGGKTGVWLADRRGENLRRVCDGSDGEWSPDGERIVFVREGRIVEREVPSGKERILSPKSWSSCLFASYCPGGRVLLVHGEGGRERLSFVRREAPEFACVLVEGDILSAPKSSPDGKRIAWQDGAHLQFFDMESCASTQLTLAAGVQSWPAWSQDGETIYYCQCAEPYDEIGEIHAVDLEKPTKAGLIQKDVNPNFYWNGSVDGPVKGHRLAGASLEVAHGEPLAVKNDWFTLRGPGDDGKVHIVPREGGAAASPVEVAVAGDGVRAESLALVKQDADRVEMKARFASKGGERTEVALRVHRTSPVVEVEPVGRAATVFIRANTSAVIAPDRYSNDLLLEPKAFENGSRIALPRAPFVLGCMKEGGILVAPLDRHGLVAVRKGPDAFEGFDIRGPVALALSGKPAWQRVEVKPADEGAWNIQWAEPFPAQWRLAAAGKGRFYSRMWDGPAPVKGFAGPPESCVMYLYGRTEKTPLNARTPVDILRDVLGCKGCESLLDIKGVRGFRTAGEWVPFLDIFTRPDGWSPTLVHTKPGDLGILEAMMGIAGVDIEPVRGLVRHLGGDIINLLDGLDRRIKEYDTFVAELRKHSQDSGVEAAKRVVGRAEELQETLAGLKVTALEDVRDAVDGVVKKGIKKGGWTNFRKEYKDLSRLSRAALSDRQKVLDAYREFARRVRDEAGLRIVRTPQVKDECEAVREMTRGILRNRYYLEGGWRGEKPLRGAIR